jgi:hypothetical protein
MSYDLNYIRGQISESYQGRHKTPSGNKCHARMTVRYWIRMLVDRARSQGLSDYYNLMLLPHNRDFYKPIKLPRSSGRRVMV